jgi:hypothetical protein
MRTFRALLAVVVVAACGTVASAQNAGAPAPIQRVPGAMPNSCLGREANTYWAFLG